MQPKKTYLSYLYSLCLLCVFARMCVCESELFMMELTPLEDSYFAIDLWTINTPFLSETIESHNQ